MNRLAEDHANAHVLATGLAEQPGITLDPSTVETNIVVFRMAHAPRFCERLKLSTACGWARAVPAEPPDQDTR